MLKTLIVTILYLACAGASYGKNAKDTISIYFAIGDHRLSPAAKHTIDSLLYNDILAPGRRVGIIGYTDNIGSEASNKTLSEQRAMTIQEYLLTMSFDSTQIESVTGVGEVSRAEVVGGYPKDRRVVIIPGGFKPYKAKVTKGQKKLGDLIRYVNDSPMIDVDQVEVNSLFKLDKVYFMLGRSDLLRPSIPMLNALYKMLRDNPGVKIQVEGHVCCAAPYNIVNGKKEPIPEGQTDTTAFTTLEDLSVHRSAAVYYYLLSRGIDKSRMRFIGYGTKKLLINPEVTEEDRAANRRVEIRVISK